jgi:hypothetical protein
VVTLHAAVPNGGLDELIVVAAVLEERAVGGVFLPMLERVLP